MADRPEGPQAATARRPAGAIGGPAEARVRPAGAIPGPVRGPGLTRAARRRLGTQLLALVAAFAALTSLVASRATAGLDWRVRTLILTGHTLLATTLAAALVLAAWPTRLRVPVLVAGTVSAAAMGLSGLMLNGDWATDVAASWLLGVAVAVAVRLVLAPAAPGESRRTAEPPGDPTPGPRRSSAAGRNTGREAARPGAPAPVALVLLDWGGTLMEDDGSQEGPMATWPRVAAVDGAAEALEALRPGHRVVVATNAQESGARDVRAALARVGLAGLVDDVVSSREVGTAKPDPFFYRAALLRAGRGGVPLAADRAVMVGDSWANDVEGARRAGLRTIWFNRAHAARPPGAEPPDGEIAHLRDLPHALATLEGHHGVADREARGDDTA